MTAGAMSPAVLQKLVDSATRLVGKYAKDAMSTGDEIAQFVVSGLTTGSIYALIALDSCIIRNAIPIIT